MLNEMAILEIGLAWTILLAYSKFDKKHCFYELDYLITNNAIFQNTYLKGLHSKHSVHVCYFLLFDLPWPVLTSPLIFNNSFNICSVTLFALFFFKIMPATYIVQCIAVSLCFLLKNIHVLLWLSVWSERQSSQITIQ